MSRLDFDLWERQPGESNQRWEAFLLYRDRPAAGEDRSLDAVARKLTKSGSLIRRWSTEDGWLRRAAAYDRHLDAGKRAALGRALEEQAEREGKQLAAAAASLSQPIVAFLRRIERESQNNRDPFADWDLRELSRAATTAARSLPSVIAAERLIAGLSSVNVGGHDGGAIKAEARARAESMSRSEAEAYLLGREDAAQGSD